MRTRLLPLPLALAALLGGCPVDGPGVDVDGDSDGYPSRVDCNDDSAAIHPDAIEVCDGLDNNCNGVVDYDVDTPPVWFADSDGDGHGDPDVIVSGCDAPDGFVELPTDCDDADPTTFPEHLELCDGADNDCDGAPDFDGFDEVDADEDGFLDCEDCDDDNAAAFPDAPEVCNGADDDCNGETDEDSALDASEWYADADEDGWGAGGAVTACVAPDGFVDRDGDCDDTEEGVFPGAVELCDGLDNDCDGEADPEGAIGLATWYLDFDGDGHGNPDVATEACLPPSDDYVSGGDDCDDGEPLVHPGATEVCDELDNDCDGAVDEDVAGAPTWYLDLDGDGFGSTAFSMDACFDPGGFSDVATDCDDGNAGVFPGASEVCDGADSNCDGALPADEVDGDGDGLAPCAGDCDDADSATYPYAPEVCDGVDNDCDTAVPSDEADADADGVAVCDGDCDDGDPSIYPGAPELCDGVDEDCDGAVDEGASSADWFLDLDGDGYGTPAMVIEDCAAPGPSGWVTNDDDCDDGDAATSPAATEVCDGADNDCDSVIPADEADADGDGAMVCEGDCDDLDAGVHPAATDFCDGVDQDCDGTYDEDGPTSETFYADDDGDTYGDPVATVTSCAAPAGYVDNDDDCDDTTDLISPAEAEACTDGIDNNCDLLTDCDDLTGCKDVEPTCWVCGDGYVDADEECDDGNLVSGDGCDSGCESEVDLSGLYDDFESGGRTVFFWQSNSNAALTSYATFCEDRGLEWFVPNSQSDAQNIIDMAFSYDAWHTWIITYNNTSYGVWGGYSIVTDSPSGQYSSSGFSAVRKWSSSFCDPETYNQTRCWDSNHSYDWLVCMDP